MASEGMNTNSRLMTVLWTMVGVYAVGTLANALFSLNLQGSLLILIALAFALGHGAVRYRWSGIVTFIVIALVVSNILENTSILTGQHLHDDLCRGSIGSKTAAGITRRCRR